MAKFDYYSVVQCKNSGNIIEVLCPGKDADVSQLNVIEAKTSGEGEPKHKPIITRVDDGYNVKVAVIELIADGQIHKQYLKPGDKPEATFKIPEADDVVAREFCTIHGLWQS